MLMKQQINDNSLQDYFPTHRVAEDSKSTE